MIRPEDYGITENQLNTYRAQRAAYEKALDEATEKREKAYNAVKNVSIGIFSFMMVASFVNLGINRGEQGAPLFIISVFLLIASLIVWPLYKNAALTRPNGFFPKYPEKYKTGFSINGVPVGYIDKALEQKCLRYLNEIEKKDEKPDGYKSKSADKSSKKKEAAAFTAARENSEGIDLGDCSTKELSEIGGILYDNGKLKAAAQYFSLAFLRGDNSVAGILGRMYEKGDGLEIDYENAASFYRIAVERGDMASAYNLARLYENGLGVKQNIIEAKELYSKAAAFGDEKAIAALKRIEREAEREKLRVCPKCGGDRRVEFGAAFCPKCGTVECDKQYDDPIQKKGDCLSASLLAKNTFNCECDYFKSAVRDGIAVTKAKKYKNKPKGGYPDVGDKYDFSHIVSYLRNDADFKLEPELKSDSLKTKLSQFHA